MSEIKCPKCGACGIEFPQSVRFTCVSWKNLVTGDFFQSAECELASANQKITELQSQLAAEKEAREKVEKELSRINERMFPIMNGPNIPWRIIAPHENQALLNHKQSLEKLAYRGGLSVCEAVAVLETRPWHRMDKDEAIKRLDEIVNSDLRTAKETAEARVKELEAELKKAEKQIKRLNTLRS